MLIISEQFSVSVLKSKLETKSVHLEECRRQLKENLEQLNIKDIALTEAKRNIEGIKTSHDDEIKVGCIFIFVHF